ncbi:DUF5671 domain-containing protein [Anaerolinea thermophila]|uniref:Hypothetical membrane protein n=1 Tax=Anaerolinea thermophila (strain DSM 14523 / JCM 11388 / NBRC 100420 / UNI-1) TaxID=926569 RepID=E8N264_ANATU|nr:DUF5671 domain-containing protein [Anaerolinea thermophila]BAJ65011.1 hypothetical membrane protein [Anaerolinea thermophila UNI-1]
MRTVRRLYFYALALVGAHALIWGSVSLLRTVLEGGWMGEATLTATGIALTLVGLPVFLLHWLTLQRDAQRDPEERFSRIRAVFLYVFLFWTLLPMLYALLALFNRWTAQFMGLSPQGVWFGASQSDLDNLVALVVNGIAFVFFARLLFAELRQAPAESFLPDARRFYRYLWMVLGLILTVLAVQGLVRYLLSLLEGDALSGAYLLANSVALALVGVPLWMYFLWHIDGALDDPHERDSVLRLVTLYLITFAGVTGTLVAGSRVLSAVLAWVLGRPLSLSDFITGEGSALALLIPLAVMWAYYGNRLNTEMTRIPLQPLREGLQRFYRSLLSALGLAVTLLGLVSLITDLFTRLLQPDALLIGADRLASSLAGLAIGLPLWLTPWNDLQGEAFLLDERGDRARRSVIRRAYLYVFIFALVVLMMLAGGNLIYSLITHLLGQPVDDLALLAITRLGMLGVFAVLLAYHLAVLRADSRSALQALGKMHAGFLTLFIVDGETALAEQVVAALHQQAPRLPVLVHSLANGVPSDEYLQARLLVLPAALALEPPPALRLWLEGYRGKRLLLPTLPNGWAWGASLPGDLRERARQAVNAILSLAEGEETPRAGVSASPWAVAGYVLGGLFAAQMLIVLMTLFISSLYGD